MNGKETSRGIQVSKKDNRRLIRLREEIQGRANEIALIMDRTLGRTAPGRVGGYSFTNSPRVQKGEVEYWVDGELVAVGCYDEETMTCFPGPCP